MTYGNALPNATYVTVPDHKTAEIHLKAALSKGFSDARIEEVQFRDHADFSEGEGQSQDGRSRKKQHYRRGR